MVSTDQSLGMQTKQTQVFNQYKKAFCVDLKLSK